MKIINRVVSLTLKSAKLYITSRYYFLGGIASSTEIEGVHICPNKDRRTGRQTKRREWRE